MTSKNIINAISIAMPIGMAIGVILIHRSGAFVVRIMAREMDNGKWEITKINSLNRGQNRRFVENLICASLTRENHIN